MKNHRIITTAVTIALLLLALTALTTSATSAAGKGWKKAVAGNTRQVKLQRTLNFAPLQNLPQEDTKLRGNLLKKPVGRQAMHPNARKLPSLPLGALPSTSGNDIAASNPGESARQGLNHHDSRYSNLFSLEPPDGGICASDKWVVQTVNDVIRVFRTDLTQYSAVDNLNHFFGLDPFVQNDEFVGPFVTDPSCYYDADTQRWFVDMSEIDNAGDGPGANIFIAVSTTPNPSLAWNIYAFSSDENFGDPPVTGCPCFGDYPQAGADKFAYVLTTNEYPVEPPYDFHGAQVYALDKRSMARGLADLSLGYYNLDGFCADDPCDFYYGLQPAKTPDSDYDKRKFDFGILGLVRGAEYMLSANDFTAFNNGGETSATSITIWGLFGTKFLRGAPPIVVPDLEFVTLDTELYGDPPRATQMDGPTPLRDCVNTDGCFFTTGADDPLGAIQTNDDSMAHTAYTRSQNLIWGALNTDILVPSPTVKAEHAGLAYFAVNVNSPSLVAQGYVAAKGEDIMFPSIALTKAGKAGMVFSLSGPDYWPSAAYTTWSGSGPIGEIHIALDGKAPQDGFTEYPSVVGEDRPRWGDYSAAQTVGDTIYMDAEYIARPACSDFQFQNYDFTCGGTRSFFANWSNALISVVP